MSTSVSVLPGTVPARRHREFARPDLVPPPPLEVGERRRLRGEAAARRRCEELAYIQRTLVWTAPQTEFISTVTRTVEEVQFALPGAQAMPYAWGHPGTGKSTAAKEAARRVYRSACTPEQLAAPHPPVVEDAQGRVTILPAVWVGTPSEAGINALSVEILIALGYAPRYRARTDLTPQVVDKVARHGVRLVVIDDTNNLALQRKDADALFNHVKNLNTTLGELNVTLAFTEARMPGSDLVSLRDNGQVSIRALQTHFRPTMIDPDAAAVTPEDGRWQAYLRRWEDALAPVLCDARPGDLANAGRMLWGFGGGAVGQIGPFLRRRAVEAVDRGLVRITPDAIRAAQPAPESLEHLRATEASV